VCGRPLAVLGAQKSRPVLGALNARNSKCILLSLSKPGLEIHQWSHPQNCTTSEMFFLYELERTITLHPSFFGPRVKEYLTNRLLEDVEGTCTGQYYIICVMDAYDISEGRVIPGSAVAEYTVHYRAVVWRPFKGETVRYT